MRQIKHLISREQIRQDLEDYDNEKLCEEHEQSPAHLEYLAQEYWNSHNYEEALDCISQVLELNPSQYSWFKAAQIHYKLQDYDLALDSLDESLKIQEDYQNSLDLKELILEKVKRDRDYTMSVYG